MHYLCTESFITIILNTMVIELDNAIKNGFYVDKDTCTHADNTEIINIVGTEDTMSGLDAAVELLGRLLNLSDSEKEIYKVLVDEIYTKGVNLMLPSNIINSAVAKYNKSTRSYYKALNSLIDKRVLSYKDTSHVGINDRYNFANKVFNQPKFIVIRLTNNR